MRASKLRNRVKVYEAKTTTNPMGGSSKPEWVHILTLHADVQPLSVRDTLQAQAVASDLKAKCILRYREDIDSSMRIEHRGRMYELDGDPLPDPNSGLEYMTIMLIGVRNG